MQLFAMGTELGMLLDNKLPMPVSSITQSGL
jgi:hypothetical protein